MKTTQMQIEAAQSPDCVAEQYHRNQATLKAIEQQIKLSDISYAMTIARGSSDHAATYAKYLFETQLGLATVSSAPSIHTLYNAKLNFKNSLVVGISQSGKSEDICTAMQAAKDGGAHTIALVNNVNSPLAEIADYVIDLCAGPELAVAATKSYICSLTALCHLAVALKPQLTFANYLAELPAKLSDALNCNWQEFIDIYSNSHDTITIGRSFSYPIAQESALKFKETCSLHAEPFSSAEFIHGPLALLAKDYPILCYAQNDESIAGTMQLIEKANQIGAQTLLAACNDFANKTTASIYLPLPSSLHPTLDPIIAIQAFYPAIAKVAVKRGYNPDKPDNLNKVTSTK